MTETPATRNLALIMESRKCQWIAAIVGCAAVVITTACRRSAPPPADSTAVSSSRALCDSVARQVATDFGTRMRLVSVLAPDSVATRELHDAYAPLVTASLLADWQHHPRAAPGRQTSTPYPARIEVDSVQGNGSECRVHGSIVEVTSSDTATAVDRVPVTLRVSDRNGWRISAFASSTNAR